MYGWTEANTDTRRLLQRNKRETTWDEFPQDTPALENTNGGAQTATLEQAPPRRFRLQTFASLRHRDFRYLWFAQLFTTAAMWIQMLTTGWMVYDMTGSALLLGAVSGLRAIPSLITSPIAGVVTDRMDRRVLMMITQVIMLVAVLAMAALILTDVIAVWHVFTFSLVSGIVWTFNTPSRQSLVPNLVPKEDLLNAYSLNAAAFQSMAIAGPAIGGFMIAWFGTGGNFLMQAAAILGVIGMVWIMRVPPRTAPLRKASMREDLAEGLKYVRNDKVVFGLVLIGIIPAFLSMPLRSLMPIFAIDILDVGSVGLGILMSASGAGALAGAITLASLGSLQRKGMFMLGAIVLTGTTMVVFSLSHWLALSLVFMLFLGLGEMTYWSMNNTILQTVVKDELRGRVMSIYMLNQGMAPLGTLVAGALAAAIGAPIVIVLMGATTVAFALAAAWRLPHMRRLT